MPGPVVVKGKNGEEYTIAGSEDIPLWKEAWNVERARLAKERYNMVGPNGTDEDWEKMRHSSGHERSDRWVAAKARDVLDDLHAVIGMLVAPDFDEQGDLTLPPVCTHATCHLAKADPNDRRFEYEWIHEDGRRDVLIPPEYMRRLIVWVDNCMSDPRRFPQPDAVVPPPAGWIDLLKKILRRLCRIYIHYYDCHWPLIQERQYADHLNYCFKYFLNFGKDFGLLQNKELRPLLPFVEKLMQQPVYHGMPGIQKNPRLPLEDALAHSAKSSKSSKTSKSRKAAPADMPRTRINFEGPERRNEKGERVVLVQRA